MDKNDNKNENSCIALVEKYEDDKDKDKDDNDCRVNKDEERTVVSADVVSKSEIIVSQGSVMVAKDMCNGLDVELFGPDDICFYGEVGC